MGNQAVLCSTKPYCRTTAACASSSCQCHEDPAAKFFDDDARLLDQLEALQHGDLLLTKLHVNAVLFSVTAGEIVGGLERLSEKHAAMANDLQFHTALRGGLSHGALPPIRLLKSLQWLFRAEELPEPAAMLTRQCVLTFFSTALAAAAAMRWWTHPPKAWRRRGIVPQEVLKGAEVRWFAVVAGLRFLACLALLQHFGDPVLLADKGVMGALLFATGYSSSLAGPEAQRLETIAMAAKQPSGKEDPEADESWSDFFTQAVLHPREGAARLLKVLEIDSSALVPLAPAAVLMPRSGHADHDFGSMITATAVIGGHAQESWDEENEVVQI